MDILDRAIRLVFRSKYALLAAMSAVAVWQVSAPVYGAYGYFGVYREPFSWNVFVQLLAYGVPGPLCHAGLVLAVAYRILTRKPLHWAVIPAGIAIAAWTWHWNRFLAHDFSHVIYHECSARFAEVSFHLESILIALTGILWLGQKTSEKTLIAFADRFLARAFLFRQEILLILWLVVAVQLVAPPLRAEYAEEAIFTTRYVVYGLQAALLVSITRSVLRQGRIGGVQFAAVIACSFLALPKDMNLAYDFGVVHRGHVRYPDNIEAMVWPVEFVRMLLTAILTAALRSAAERPADA